MTEQECQCYVCVGQREDDANRQKHQDIKMGRKPAVEETLKQDPPGDTGYWTYCGLVCGHLLEDQQKILDQCITHYKYDPEFAPKMVDKLIDLCLKTKAAMIKEQ